MTPDEPTVMPFAYSQKNNRGFPFAGPVRLLRDHSAEADPGTHLRLCRQLAAAAAATTTTGPGGVRQALLLLGLLLVRKQP